MKAILSQLIKRYQSSQVPLRLDKKMTLYADYAKACHRSQTFN